MGGTLKKGTRRVEGPVRIPPPAGFGTLPFSMGVFAGDTFYTGGHIGMDPETRKVPAGPDEEIRFLLDGFRATLQRAGLCMDDLAFVQVFCSDVSLFEQFNAIYTTYFQATFPARAFIGSGPLLFGVRFEIQGIAVRASGDRSAIKRSAHESALADSACRSRF